MIGLTGPTAAGKSTIGAMLAARGAEVIDADQVYHGLVRPGAPLTRAIADRFGADVLRDDGALDRARLAALVLGRPALLRQLDVLTHPAVVREVTAIIERSMSDVVVVEAIKLAESGLTDEVDQLWLITADPETRKQRLMERNHLCQEAAKARVAASSDPLPAGVEADVVIDTTVGLAATRRAVDQAWQEFVRLPTAR